MFLDMIFGIMFLVGVIIFSIKFFFNTTKIEWAIHKWFIRTFHICQHKVGYEYMARGYNSMESTIYSIRCYECNREITWIIANDEKTKEILDSSIDFRWKLLSKENYKIIMENAWVAEDEYIRDIKEMQKDVIKKGSF